MADYKVIDADGHVRESLAGMREFLEPRWQRRNLFPNDAWDRDLRGKLGAKPEGPTDQLAAMDEDGIDVMVLYPTAGLHVGSLHELDFATAVSRAYNDWLYHFCKVNAARLKFAALLAPQDPKAAAEELERAVTERGALAGVLPTYLPQRPDFGDFLYDPIYAAAERLGVGLGFHTGTSADSLGGLRFPQVPFGPHDRPSRGTDDGDDRDHCWRRVRTFPEAEHRFSGVRDRLGAVHDGPARRRSGEARRR